MARKWIVVGGLVTTFAATSYAVYLSLDPDNYFHYTTESSELWQYDPVEVAAFALSFVVSGLLAIGAFLSTRPHWLWQRAALALIILAPWAFVSLWAVIHAPAFIIVHGLWILGLALLVFISGLVSLAVFIIRRYTTGSDYAV